jgi:hypothetical protein
MSVRSKPHSIEAFVHAAFIGAAIALFLFLICWAGDAIGFYPPAGRLIDLISASAEMRTHDAFWRGAASAALFGAVVAALIAFGAESVARMQGRRR